MPAINYSGALQSKKKGELQDIASALRMPTEGTRDDLMHRIKKHLDDHPNLEENPIFAGLYGRRKRSIPPQSQGATKTTTRTMSRSLPTLPETPDKPTTLSVAQLEGTPSSLPPLPPSEASLSVVQRITAVVPVDKLKQAISTRYDHAKVTQNSSEMLQSSRGFLSNSLNIWSLTALGDLGFILYHIVPWKYVNLSYSPPASFTSPLSDISIPYPPAYIFSAPAFWSVILHWLLPSLIVPSVFGYLISFAPSKATPLSFDPLTASIVRLAAQIAWQFPSPKSFMTSGRGLQIITHQTYGLDILGPQWRVLIASVTLMFAFAEQISKAPTSLNSSSSNHELALKSISARRLAIEEDDLSSEID